MNALTRVAAALAFLASPGALAGNLFPVQTVAFSASGAQVFVLSGGEADGSGFAVADLEVRSTASGQVTRRDHRTRETGTGAALARALLQARQPQLRALGFVPGRSARPVYRRAFPAGVTWGEGTRAGGSRVTPVTLWSKPVPVRLDVKAAPNRCVYAGMLPPGDRPAAFTLSVNGKRVATGGGDTCTTRYALEAAYVQGNRAAFVLRAYTVGFEGPDARVQVVAVTLR